MNDLDHAGTIPAPPPTPDEQDTGKVSKQTTEDVRVYLAVVQMQEQLGAIARYLEGRLDGVTIDVAQSQAFEMRASRALSELDQKIDRVLLTLESLATNTLDVHQRVVSLEEWRRRHELEAQVTLIKHQEAL